MLRIMKEIAVPTKLSGFWNRGIFRSTKKIAPINAKAPFAVESLEDRRLAAVDIYFDDGIRGNGPDHPELRGVHIVGTDRADRIEITHQNGQLRVWAARPTGTGLASVFDANEVPRIFFNGLGGNDVFTSNSSIETIAHGGEGDDEIDGGWGRVELYGDGGNDYLHAGNLAYGAMFGGFGNDEIRAGARGMDLFGEEENDFLYGGNGNDFLSGGDGNDQLWGGAGNDSLQGGGGSDQIQGQDGNDKIWGEDGFDFLEGNDGRDTISGGKDRDYLDGGDDQEVDELYGDEGPDIFRRQWTFTGGYFVYDDDATYDFSPSQGDRFYDPDFIMLATEWAGMSFAEMYRAAGKVAGFAASEDPFTGDEALGQPSSFLLDPAGLMLSGLNSDQEIQSTGLEWTEFDANISILATERELDYSIDPMPLIDDSITHEPYLQDLRIIDAAISDFLVAPVITQVSLTPTLRSKTSLRLF
jgi:hypothetical protein